MSPDDKGTCNEDEFPELSMSNDLSFGVGFGAVLRVPPWFPIFILSGIPAK